MSAHSEFLHSAGEKTQTIINLCPIDLSEEEKYKSILTYNFLEIVHNDVQDARETSNINNYDK